MNSGDRYIAAGAADNGADLQQERIAAEGVLVVSAVRAGHPAREAGAVVVVRPLVRPHGYNGVLSCACSQRRTRVRTHIATNVSALEATNSTGRPQ